MKIKGLDLSHWNRVLDFNAIKKAGVDFVILKAGGYENGKHHTDSKFEEYYSKAIKAGIDVGAYYFIDTRALTENRPIEDANAFLYLLKDKQLNMPVYLDFERGYIKNKKENTDYVIAFLNHLESHNYYAGLYASDISGFKERLDKKRLLRFTWWVARYGIKPSFATENLHIWQKSSTHMIDGIVGKVDLDESYINFPIVIKKKGLNIYE